MINELIKLATHLDKKGLTKEADYLDAVIKSVASGYRVPVQQKGNPICPPGMVYDNGTKGCVSQAAAPGVVAGKEVVTDKAHDHCVSKGLKVGTEDFEECKQEYYEEVREKREEMRNR